MWKLMMTWRVRKQLIFTWTLDVLLYHYLPGKISLQNDLILFLVQIILRIGLSHGKCDLVTEKNSRKLLKMCCAGEKSDMGDSGWLLPEHAQYLIARLIVWWY